MADLAESVHNRLAPVLDHSPREVTHIVLTDNTESANGSATALPYNTIRLFVTAPDDMSPLVDYEDWYLELVTHEYTHILHTDNISGAPAIVNAIVGKTLAPNQLQPRWVLEGLAVLEESEHTSGGRNRSAIFDMYLRADVLEHHIATLDQISHSPRRWPGGNLWYLYGSRFLTWIADTYGEQVMREIANDYGQQLVPYGINRSIRRATGSTYEELYDGWVTSLKRTYNAQIEAAREAPGGLCEGTRLTHHGRLAQRPRWVPVSARRNPTIPEVLYYLDDGHRRAGFYRMPILSSSRALESERDLWIRSGGTGSASFARNGDIFFSSTEVFKRVYLFSDLLHLPNHVSSEEGDEPERIRLSEGLRALDPDVRPDGRQITYSVNHHGTQYLSVSDITPEGELGPARILIPSGRFQLAQTPRYSPNGKHIAYSAWSPGGYRDIRIADATTGQFYELSHDRAVDLQPSWSPDGQTIYFSSDRTGIHNIYAYDMLTQKLWQVTNVQTGAYMPEVSADGKTLLYIGYTSAGFDLYGMDVDRSHWVPAPSYLERRPEVTQNPSVFAWDRHPYNPWPTLRPHAYGVTYGPGTFGSTLVLSTKGADALGHHTLQANIAADTSRADPQFSLAYTYGRLPFNVTSTFFRSLVPNNSYRVNGTTPNLVEEDWGWSNAISYSIPREFESFSFLLGYTVSHFNTPLPLGSGLNPYSTITINPAVQGMLAVVRSGFQYNKEENYVYSIGGSRGFSFQVTADIGNQETASEYSYYSFGYSLLKLLQMPWHPDHSLILHAQSAIGGGSYPRRGLFYVGGLVDLPPLDAFQNNLFQGGFVLRGYPPNTFSGRQFHLGNLEYRFPLWYPERGLSTLPAFFNRVAGALFLDYGGAFDTLDVIHWHDQFHTSFGGELLLDTTLGYLINTTTRIGYAKGTSTEAYPGGKFYLVVSTPY